MHRKSCALYIPTSYIKSVKLTILTKTNSSANNWLKQGTCSQDAHFCKVRLGI